MPMALIRAYLDDLPGVKAEWEALLLESASFPHMDAGGRRAALRRMENAGGARVTQKPTRAGLKLAGIGVQVGSKEQLAQ